MSYMDAFHSVLGLEWWAALGAMTLVTRSALLPFFMTTMKQTARMQRAKAETEPLQQTLKDMNAKVWADMQDGKKPTASPEALAAKEQLDKVYQKYGIDPRMAFVGLVPNLGVMISCYMGITAMAANMPSWRTGGALWFTDLSVADPTLMLPVINGVVMFGGFQLATMVNKQTGVTVPGQEFHKYLPYVVRRRRSGCAAPRQRSRAHGHTHFASVRLTRASPTQQGLFVPAFTHQMCSGVQLYWILAGLVNVSWQGMMYVVPDSHARLAAVAEVVGWSGAAGTPQVPIKPTPVVTASAPAGDHASTVYALGSQPAQRPTATKGKGKRAPKGGGGRRRAR